MRSISAHSPSSCSSRRAHAWASAASSALAALNASRALAACEIAQDAHQPHTLTENPFLHRSVFLDDKTHGRPRKMERRTKIENSSNSKKRLLSLRPQAFSPLRKLPIDRVQRPRGSARLGRAQLPPLPAAPLCHLRCRCCRRHSRLPPPAQANGLFLAVNGQVLVACEHSADEVPSPAGGADSKGWRLRWRLRSARVPRPNERRVQSLRREISRAFSP